MCRKIVWFIQKFWTLQRSLIGLSHLLPLFLLLGTHSSASEGTNPFLFHCHTCHHKPPLPNIYLHHRWKRNEYAIFNSLETHRSFTLQKFTDSNSFTVQTSLLPHHLSTLHIFLNYPSLLFSSLLYSHAIHYFHMQKILKHQFHQTLANIFTNTLLHQPNIFLMGREIHARNQN